MALALFVLSLVWCEMEGLKRIPSYILNVKATLIFLIKKIIKYYLSLNNRFVSCSLVKTLNLENWLRGVWIEIREQK